MNWIAPVMITVVIWFGLASFDISCGILREYELSVETTDNQISGFSTSQKCEMGVEIFCLLDAKFFYHISLIFAARQ